MAGGHREDQLQLLPTPQCAFRSLQHWLVRRAYGGIWIMRSPWRRVPQRREESLRVSALECSRGGHSLDTTGAQNLADAAGVSDSNHSHASRAKNFAAGNVGGYDCRLAPSAPKCPRVGHKMDTIDGHNFHQWDRDRAVTTEQNWWAGTGLNRRHQDFRSIPRNRQERESADPVSGDWIDVVDLEYPRMVLNTLDGDTLWTHLPCR
jgi:hypothetical protein